MESSNSDAHIRVGPGPSTAVPPAVEKPLKIRWGRTFLALVGLLALLAAGISGALNVFSLGSAAVSWTGLAVFIAVIFALRTLAVRDQAARRTARRAASTTPMAPPAVSQATALEHRETALFDGAEGAPPAAVQKPLTAAELRAAALRVAAKGTADAKLADTETLAETWVPVEVPVPGYVTAARALSLEKPLNLPKAPKSTGASIKADQAGVGEGPNGVAAVPEAPGVEAPKIKASQPSAPPVSVPAAERGSYALNNLDDVLQRRRA